MDNQVTIIGSRNVADEYFDASEDARFSDLEVVGIGPVVAEVSRMFDRYWNHETALPVPAFAEMPDDPAAELERVRHEFATARESALETKYAAAVRGKVLDAMDFNPSKFSWAAYKLAYDSPDKGVESRAEEGGVDTPGTRRRAGIRPARIGRRHPVFRAARIRDREVLCFAGARCAGDDHHQFARVARRLAGARRDKYGNGRFRYQPLFAPELIEKWASSWSGLNFVQPQDRTVLTVSDSAETGTLVLPFASAYPLLAGRIRVTGQVEGGGEILVEFSEEVADGGKERTWLAVGKSEGDGRFALDLPTRGFFRNGHDRPVYAYSLRFSLRRPVWLDRIVVESDFQHAPHALPELKPGLNRVDYWDDTAGARHVEIAFQFDENEPSDSTPARDADAIAD